MADADTVVNKADKYSALLIFAGNRKGEKLKYMQFRY